LHFKQSTWLKQGYSNWSTHSFHYDILRTPWTSILVYWWYKFTGAATNPFPHAILVPPLLKWNSVELACVRSWCARDRMKLAAKLGSRSDIEQHLQSIVQTYFYLPWYTRFIGLSISTNLLL
jgi:hypothetical protein